VGSSRVDGIWLHVFADCDERWRGIFGPTGDADLQNTIGTMAVAIKQLTEIAKEASTGFGCLQISQRFISSHGTNGAGYVGFVNVFLA
jgi:hypothetical protein